VAIQVFQVYGALRQLFVPGGPIVESISDDLGWWGIAERFLKLKRGSLQFGQLFKNRIRVAARTAAGSRHSKQIGKEMGQGILKCQSSNLLLAVRCIFASRSQSQRWLILLCHFFSPSPLKSIFFSLLELGPSELTEFAWNSNGSISHGAKPSP